MCFFFEYLMMNDPIGYIINDLYPIEYIIIEYIINDLSFSGPWKSSSGSSR